MKSLFGDFELEQEAGEPARAEGPFAGVALENSLDKVLDYAIPPNVRDQIRVGQRVRVPLGRNNKPAYGYVISVRDTTDYPKVKPLLNIDDERVLVTPKLMELALWMSRYYCAALGSVIESIVPSAVKKKTGIGHVNMVSLLADRARVQAMMEKTKAPKRRAVLARLLLIEPGESVELVRLASEAGATPATVKKLARIGIITVASQMDVQGFATKDAPAAVGNGSETDRPLNEDQQKVFDEIRPRLAGGFSVNLVLGVTGSGKTEVYLQCMREVVNAGKQAVVLVPEIALTPQTVRRFTARFKRVAILHSGLTATERHRYWQMIASGEADIVVGARSAIFAPLPNLGMIVVDEEHESSYKQDTVPRYHARDVAIKRAQLEGIPVMLGSATPSLETWWRVSDEATKRRSDEAKEEGYGASADLSGPDRVATGHGVGKGGVPGDGADAGIGEVRAGESNAAGSGIGPVEHRGGTRTSEPGGLFEVPPGSARVIGGIVDSGGTRVHTQIDPAGPGAVLFDGRDRPSPPGTDSGLGTQDLDRAQVDPVTLPLRRSVAPSLRRPTYHLLTLPRRVRGLAMPHVELVDMKLQLKYRKGVHLLSERLEGLLRVTLQQGHQAILLLNRRGYSNFVYCVHCQEAVQCKYCDTTMTYHRAAGTGVTSASNAMSVHSGHLHCHYCLAVQPLPDKCPTCQKKLSLFGLGTQRVEEELSRKFPDLKYARVDSDTMRNSKDYEELLGRFARGEVQVMLGTQMIAKGLDYPNVTLVGVVSGDTSLSLPDFRAAERTFQLITQVAGRAGRGDHPGRVVLQTYMPDDPTIQSAIKQDFLSFAKRELLHRKEVGLPPFGRMVRIVLRDQDQDKLHKQSEVLAAQVADAVDQELLGDPDKRGIIVRGPMPCAISRIAGYFRNQIVLGSARADRLQRVLKTLREKGDLAKTDRIAVDVDPVSLL